MLSGRVKREHFTNVLDKLKGWVGEGKVRARLLGEQLAGLVGTITMWLSSTTKSVVDFLCDPEDQKLVDKNHNPLQIHTELT